MLDLGSVILIFFFRVNAITPSRNSWIFCLLNQAFFLPDAAVYHTKHEPAHQLQPFCLNLTEKRKATSPIFKKKKKKKILANFRD
jgi:hypothetical protein